jgi:hypothetical protein
MHKDEFGQKHCLSDFEHAVNRFLLLSLKIGFCRANPDRCCFELNLRLSAKSQDCNASAISKKQDALLISMAPVSKVAAKSILMEGFIFSIVA